MTEPPGDPESPADEAGLALAVLAARVADDKKADDVVILDVGPILSITGYFVVAGANNPRLGRTVIDAVEEAAKLELDRAPVRSEGLREQQWMLLDYGDVVLHVFVGDVRDFYEIERLYTDAARIDWRDASGPADS